MKRTILVDGICYFFILLFLYTGAIKLTEIHLFKEQLISSPLLGALSGFIAWALPIGELLIAIALFIPVLRLKALYVTLGLMSVFTLYVVSILLIDNQLSCSCGGIIEELSPKQHILFNSACVILSLMAILVLRKQQPTQRFKWLTGTSAACLFLVVGWTLFVAFTTPATIKTGMEGRALPSFDLQLMDSTTYLKTDAIPEGQPFIVVGFSPWCTHCQAETRDIIQQMDQFKNVHIYYMTAYPFGQMKAFYQYFKLQKFPNIIMGRDTSNTFLHFFKATGVPYTAVFDPHKRLKRVIAGQTSANALAQAVTK